MTVASENQLRKLNGFFVVLIRVQLDMKGKLARKM
jgi:hypothetical protein